MSYIQQSRGAQDRFDVENTGKNEVIATRTHLSGKGNIPKPTQQVVTRAVNQVSPIFRSSGTRRTEVQTQPIQQVQQTQQVQQVPSQRQSKFNYHYQMAVEDPNSRDPRGTRIIKKNDYGKIVEERNNYRLYLSGVGYVDVDEAGKPIMPQKTETVVKKSIPLAPPKPEPIVEPPKPKPEPPKVSKILEQEKEVKTTLVKLVEEEEPTYTFKNLGTTSKDGAEGKKVFYRIIEAIPEGEGYEEYKQTTTTIVKPPVHIESGADQMITCAHCHNKFDPNSAIGNFVTQKLAEENKA